MNVVNMTIEIADARTFFWQWDTGCKLRLVGAEAGNQAHFFRDGMAEPFAVPLYALGDDIVCDIPDEMLQIAKTFAAYTYMVAEDGSKTHISRTFTVESRPKPADYIYTPTEKFNLQQAVDVAVKKLFIGELSRAMIDVDVLPTENIRAVVLYHTPDGLYWYDGEWHRLVDEEELALAVKAEADRATAREDEIESNLNTHLENYDAKMEELDACDAKHTKDIEGLKSSKVNVSDIADDLDTEDPNKVLSANQGRIIRESLEFYLSELQKKDTANAEAIVAEKNRAEAVESDIYEKIDDINADADDALSIADDALDVAKEARGNSETNAKNLANEITRATGAEEQIISDFTASDAQLRSEFTESDSQLRSDLETTDAIAKGANVALAFSNYETMVYEFNYNIDRGTYRVGQNVYIITPNVPDLWVSKINTDPSYFNYDLEGGDSGIVSNLENNGYIRVGFYELSPLETQKVNLTEYAKIADVPKVGKNGFVLSNGYLYNPYALENDFINKKETHFLRPAHYSLIGKYGVAYNNIALIDTEKASAQKWLGVPGLGKTYTYSEEGDSVPLTYGGEAYHQSDDTYSVEHIIGASYGYYDENYTHSNTISESMIVENTEDGITIQIDKNFAYIFIAYTTKFVPSVSNSPLPKVGIYFSYYDSDGDLYYITNLTLNVIDERKYSKKTEAIDYTDNDTSSPSHMLNRPCYVKDEFDKTYPPSMSANSTSIEGISSYIQEWYYCIDPATFSPNDANWYKKFMSDIGAYAINVEYSNYCTGRQITGTRRYSLSGANIRSIVGGYIISVKTDFTPDAYLLLLYDAIAFGDTIQNSSFNNGVYLGRIVVDDDTGGTWHNDESRITMLYKMQVKALDNSLLDLSKNAFLLQNLLNFKKAVVPNGKSFSLKSGMFAMVFPNDMLATLKQSNGDYIGEYDIGASLIYVSDIADNKCDIALMSFRSNPPSTSVGSYTPNKYGVVGYITNITTSESPKDLYVYYLERG